MKNKQSAFTLVEAMVAVTILSLIVAMVYGTFFSVMRVTQTGAKATQQIQRERIALKTIEAALSGIVYYEQNQQHYPKQCAVYGHQRNKCFKPVVTLKPHSFADTRNEVQTDDNADHNYR